ncbi:DUF2057 family protein [Thalassotalea atypica]|uniref:DUF2057 family protein n=1 Tax=Thalassotalea atypica TaxID=2054316 RepID=UPI00257228A2|nr:DUF2057 family protein [Thalassotalea atypica]
MQYRNIFIYFFGCFFSGCVVASSLTIDEPLELLKINGQEHVANFFASKTSIDLVKGRHVVLMRYKDIFDDSDEDDHTTVKSEPFIVIFDITDDNQQLVAVSPEINNLKAARGFAEEPSMSLIEQATDSVVSTEVMSLVEFEQKQFQAAITLPPVKQKPSTPVVVDQKVKLSQTVQNPKKNFQAIKDNASLNDASQNTRALEMLMYWWQEASQEDKKIFLEKVDMVKE